MSGIFLSSTVRNAEYALERAIPALASGSPPPELDIHDLCTFFRQRGVAMMLLEGIADSYHLNTMQSCSAFLYILPQVPEDAKTTSFAKPLFDAMGSGYWDCAEAIGRNSRMTWDRHREYEDDFLYVKFLIEHGLLGAPRAAVEQTLERYEEVLEGASDVRLDLCRALLDSQEEDFDQGLRTLLVEREAKVEGMIERETISSDAATWLRHFATEGVALLELARRLGLKTGTRHLHCPQLVLGGSPFVYEPNAWRVLHPVLQRHR